ncbi:glycosyl transferase [Actinobacillus genomosp. 2]|uniref:glycosyltransferase family 32 protein n=1 Tax=Actinobacillus genomosp. 2 TaxID=230709 RepID=UPI002441B0DF|nr:glycosyltransferase [Actinobacillus genomosp. 2]WGE31936.1 glycosyl transferase [Actinobacillus genomosp. 2]
MIPKKIHYCWFGGNPLPKSVKKCIESWKKYCPDYEIIEWNESNYNVHKNLFIKEAYEKKKFAFVSDYARLDVVYSEGGIYLDTDVELIKPIDDLLAHSCFLASESIDDVATGLGFGAEKGHWFIAENMSVYENMHFNMENIITCVEITTKLLIEKGFSSSDEVQQINDIVIYPTEYFCPLNYKTHELHIKQNTYSIHHYDATWQSPLMKFKTKIKYILCLAGIIK